MQVGNQHKTKSRVLKIYLGLAFFFIIALSIFWSIDNSLIYIFLGLALIFFCLATRVYYSNRSPQQSDYIHYSKDTERHEHESLHFLDELQNIFKEKGIAVSQPPKTYQAQKGVSPKIIIVAGVFFIFCFITIIISIFSDSNNDPQFYYQLGESFYMQGEYDSASINYKRALSQNQDYPEALTGYGNVLMMKQQNDSALIMYDKALELDAMYEPALYQKALVLYYNKNYDQSIHVSQRILNRNSSQFDAMQLMGDNYYNQNEYDSALLWYDNAYTGGLRNRYLCHLMGYIHQTKGNNSKAISLYKEALQYDSAVVDIYERLGELLPVEQADWYKRKATKIQSQN